MLHPQWRTETLWKVVLCQPANGPARSVSVTRDAVRFLTQAHSPQTPTAWDLLLLLECLLQCLSTWPMAGSNIFRLGTGFFLRASAVPYTDLHDS